MGCELSGHLGLTRIGERELRVYLYLYLYLRDEDKMANELF